MAESLCTLHPGACMQQADCQMSSRRHTLLALKAKPVAQGERFGRWTVVEEAEAVPAKKHKRFIRVIRCRCDCGATRAVRLDDLRSGKSTNCGCLKHQQSRERATKHGQAATPLHRIWRGMKDRCLNPANSDYANYGGRGIRVCDEWLNDFAAFAAHVGLRPPCTTLDRIDNDKNYEPGNVRWATATRQRRNNRNNRIVVFDGRRLPLADACELAGVDHRQAYKQLTERGGSYAGMQLVA